MPGSCAATSIGLGDRDPERTGRVLALGAAGLGDVRWGAVHGRAPGLHHRASIGLLVVARPHHPDLALQAEQPARERERRAPLTGTGLGRELLDPGGSVLVSLRHSGIRFVRAGRGAPLVLVIDVSGRIELALEPERAVQWRRAPQLVGIAHRFGNLDLRLGGDLLLDQAEREQGREVVRSGRLLRAGMKRGRRVARQIRHQVDPVGRDVLLAEHELHSLVGHRFSFPRSPACGAILCFPAFVAGLEPTTANSATTSYGDTSATAMVGTASQVSG